MPVVAHHAVCPECHELASDDSPQIRTRETDARIVTQQSDGQLGPQESGSIVVNETAGDSDEKAESRPGTTELPPVASHLVPIDPRPLHQSHAVQSFDERGEESSTPSLEGETGTFNLTPRVSCIPGTPPTPNLLQTGCEEAHINVCKVAARPFSHSTEPRAAKANLRDRNERYEQDSMRYQDESDDDDNDDEMPDEGQDVVPNPILEVGRRRVPSVGRGCLFPGSLFRGKQTSGRSSYDVEVRILDVSFPTSTISGYLSISHLTETHPRLTTFFSGEIIGSTHGFLTGPAFYSAQATEPDDMRHWSRFEHFQKVKGDLKRPGLTMHDEASASASGVDEEKPFCFMRWKERFLVPDHKVRDISGASFAGA
ncbi:hypothetical protein QFC22_006646 [Naganishia vaughanmartiniae]|uniref:Uncharacterized protein n=1 Tax=Naganishia vaughanmartiniae TaxID=1424756 RepID=A0ACC2WIT4_9TREE|nr:hypothetical protein QFC22_006646 [Naganishia vaughanmartiniae]